MAIETLELELFRRDGYDSHRAVDLGVFSRTVKVLVDLLEAANKLEPAKSARAKFEITNLRFGSAVVVIKEVRAATLQNKPSAIEASMRQLASLHDGRHVAFGAQKTLIKPSIRLANMFKTPEHEGRLRGGDQSTILDQYLYKCAHDFKNYISNADDEGRHFAGIAYGTFVGRLASLDYSTNRWKATLMLPGGAIIECVLDSRKDAGSYNPYGNQRVAVTGRAIYRHDNALPQRLEITDIRPIPMAVDHVDLRGSLEDGMIGGGLDGWISRAQ